ncbi:MAG: hypothetical protein LQ346_004408 [Caloplaca aetnensis]|nr:MAG: hypothetical protein LQ346_004408 [Caloplaca aetnensis]
MAASELTAPSTSFKAGGSDDYGSLNVDEFLQATVEEAINQPDLEDNLDHHAYTQGLESISISLFAYAPAVEEGLTINHVGQKHHSISLIATRGFTEPEDQAKLHRSDLWSSWFNVPNRQGRAKLYVYPRPQTLINKAQAVRDGSRPFEQYPSLVSFFGETGGGKSTIISALVRNAALYCLKDVPIPGNHAERFRSTSAGIHLYCDPKTIDSDVPLFYADCEGLRGSAVPVAAHSVEGDVRFTSRRYHDHHPVRDRASSNLRGPVEDHRDTAVRAVSLQWANSQVIQSDKERLIVLHPKSREIVVNQLYPRLLYTFSDVVCYVTNNPRATETELDHLFQWASIGHDRTVNQAVRPGLIIVINKDAPDSDERWLDVDYATNELLRHLELSTKFEDLKEQWRLRGSCISTAKDLILCYYDSFRIICIPSLTPETTHEITIQFSKLYREIRDTSRRLRSKRIRAQMNLDVRSFCNYVEHVYNRLARDMLSSVDFHYLASRNATRPIKFRDHVVALMVKLKEDEENVDPPCDVKETELIKRVIPFLASCIASHSVNDNTQRGPSSAMK